jgi:ABC-type lipoprotein export system ATPase subunit
VLALNSVDLEIPDREFTAIVGESGSGKSTLLHLLGGLDKPDQGEILVDGWSLTSAGERGLTQYRRTRLGIVFQFFNLLPTLNLFENGEARSSIQSTPRLLRLPKEEPAYVSRRQRVYGRPRQLPPLSARPPDTPYLNYLSLGDWMLSR